MESLILFLVILIFAYITTNFLFGKIKTKYYIPTGIEYIFLGVLLGPSFSNWLNSTFNFNIPMFLNDSILSQLNPGISASIGFIGFIYGLNFKIREFSNAKPEHWRLVFSDMLFSFIIVGGISFGAFTYLFPQLSLVDRIAAAYALSIASGVTSFFLIKNLRENYNLDGKVSISLSNYSLININLNIFLYGLLFAIIHKGEKVYISFTPVEWIVLSILLTFLVGFLFFIFIGREKDQNKLFVAVLGIVLFTSGIAYYMNFSPLYMNFILGAVVANLSKITDELETSLERIFHPLSILIVIFAGFYWVPSGIYTFLIGAVAIILLRILSKYTSGYIAFASAYDKDLLDAKIGRGMLTQDIVVCAMVIDYINVYQNTLTPIVVSVILVSVIVFSIFGYNSSKNLMIDTGELKRETL